MSANTGPMTTYRKGKPVMVDFDAGGSTYNAGDVILVGPSPVIAHEAIPAFTGGKTLDAVAAGGGIYECVTDGTPVIGEDVYWDATNKKLTATAAGNTHFGILVAGPTFLASGASPAADGDLGLALHRPKGSATNTLPGTRSVATVSATGTLTAAQVVGGFVHSVPAGAITLTLPTAANLVAGLPGAKVGDAIDLVIDNSSAGANAITLAAGAGGTLRQSATTILQNATALVRIVLTNVTPTTEAYTAVAVISA